MRTEVLFVGLDGLDPGLVREWEDDLPTIAGLVEDGSFGRIRSADPPLSAPAWPWLYTGKQGGKHGCFGFTRRRTGTYEWEPVNYGDVRAESLWEALDAAGVACGVANVPFTYPPSDLEHGYVLAGWPIPNRATPSEPPDVVDLVESDLGERYRVHPFPMGPELEAADPDEVLEHLVDGLWHHERAFEALLTGTDVEVFACTFMATDVAGHYLGWHHEQLRELYVAADEAVAALLDAAPDDVDVVLASDHGHGARSEWNFHVNEWLREAGYLTLRDESDEDGRLSSGGSRSLLRRLGLTREGLVRAAGNLGVEDVRAYLPQSVFELLKSVVPPAEARDEGFAPDRVDWTETVAYAPGQNVVHLNTAADHPKGTVADDDVDDVRSAIAEDLAAVEHPQEERTLVTDVRHRDDVFDGPYVADAPDLVFVADDMHCTVQTGFTGGDSFVRDRWSEHRPDGTLVTAGPSFADRELDDGSEDEGESRPKRDVRDVFPLVLDLVDAPIPEDVDGDIPAERLEDPPAPTFRPSRDGDGATARYTGDEREEVEAKLQGLGYLE